LGTLQNPPEVRHLDIECIAERSRTDHERAILTSAQVGARSDVFPVSACHGGFVSQITLFL